MLNKPREQFAILRDWWNVYAENKTYILVMIMEVCPTLFRLFLLMYLLDTGNPNYCNAYPCIDLHTLSWACIKSLNIWWSSLSNFHYVILVSVLKFARIFLGFAILPISCFTSLSVLPFWAPIFLCLYSSIIGIVGYHFFRSYQLRFVLQVPCRNYHQTTFCWFFWPSTCLDAVSIATLILARSSSVLLLSQGFFVYLFIFPVVLLFISQMVSARLRLKKYFHDCFWNGLLDYKLCVKLVSFLIIFPI